jgi:sugar O-acyltransferase (sialic acid O-acetyltransferase NeuD family)
MAKVIIWGTKDGAQLAHFYLTQDSSHDVVGFTMDAEFIDVDSFEGLPVCSFEDLPSKFPPTDYKMFVPISQRRMNKYRIEKYFAAKAKGYELISYISSKATFYGTPVGDNCFIFENNVIQPFTQIGNNVTLWSGNHIGHHSVIEDHVFVSSHVVISGHAVIGEESFLGVNSTIQQGIKIARRSYIGAGSLIKQDTVETGVYPGIGAELSKVPSSKIPF